MSQCIASEASAGPGSSQRSGMASPALAAFGACKGFVFATLQAPAAMSPLAPAVPFGAAARSRGAKRFEPTPNPSVNRTSNSGLRPPSAAGYLKR
jgi:hypothetical protein